MPTGKSSFESARSGSTLDRWSQRRLHRLKTEHGFREQRQQGHGKAQQSPMTASSTYSSSANTVAWEEAASYREQQPQAGPPASAGALAALGGQQQSQQHSISSATAPPAAAVLRSSTAPNPYASSSFDPSSTHSGLARQHHPQYQYRSPSTPPPHGVPPPFNPQQQYEAQPQQEFSRPALINSRSNPLQYTRSVTATTESSSMSSSNLPGNGGNGGLAAAKTSMSGGSNAGTANSNRHSMHNGLSARDAAALAALAAHGVAQGGQGHNPSAGIPASKSTADVARGGTPQPVQSGDDMSPEEVNQLIKEHKELREKYTKVKKYYFEKEDQVKQLQNSLAHQRLSQSRTSLDDSEYATRFNRLDGLVAQLAFGIRKNWRSVPSWLAGSVNKDAVATGKQEMTAVGRAAISCWLVEEVFDKYFHPDLDPSLSAQLRSIQKNMRRYASFPHTTEDEDLLTTKIVNWRLATLEGLQDALRSPQCATHGAELTDTLKDQLCNVLAVHLQDPPPPELEGGVHMIIELVIHSIAIHLPLESRDVVIEYSHPGEPIATDHMKLESGIPPLATSIAEDEETAAVERASTRSGTSDHADSSADLDPAPGTTRKRSRLSALTGVGLGGGGSGGGGGGSGSGGAAGSSSAKQKPADARSPQPPHGKLGGGSSSSLARPDSAHGSKEQQGPQPPRVRIAAGVCVQIRGRSVLVKAPVFAAL